MRTVTRFGKPYVLGCAHALREGALDRDGQLSVASMLHDLAEAMDQQPGAALSFRDQCAIAAMQAWIRTYGNTEQHDGGSALVARCAFNVADAMDSERNKRSQS